MKAELIREVRTINPEYSTKAHRAAKQKGEVYGISPYMMLPVGFVIEGPFVWGECCPGYKGEPPRAKPVDDECKKRVTYWMEVERPKQLDLIRQMAKSSKSSKMTPAKKAHLEDLVRVYGLDEDDNQPLTETETETTHDEISE